MDIQSIDQFMDNDDAFYDFGIDYEFLSGILNSETQLENSSSTHDNTHLDLDVTFDISEFEMAEMDLNIEPKLDGNGNGGWVRRRRLKKGSLEYIRHKEENRIKNRLSARKSIEKKEAYIRELEVKIRRLEAENKFRGRVMQIFPNSKPTGKLCGLRRSFSTSDFYINGEIADEEKVDIYF